MSAQIDASVPLRGFVVYLRYDTTMIKLAVPPVTGTLVRNVPGLNFSYFDHPPFYPTLLSVGGAVMGSATFSGPGELFQIRFLLRQCGDASISMSGTPYLQDTNGVFITSSYTPAVIMVCPRIPVAVSGLTISQMPNNSFALYWPPASTDLLGRRLFVPVAYRVLRQQIQPEILSPLELTVVADTSYVDVNPAGTQCLYHIVVSSTP
jgi:hypothetical protein